MEEATAKKMSSFLYGSTDNRARLFRQKYQDFANGYGLQQSSKVPQVPKLHELTKFSNALDKAISLQKNNQYRFTSAIQKELKEANRKKRDAHSSADTRDKVEKMFKLIEEK